MSLRRGLKFVVPTGNVSPSRDDPDKRRSFRKWLFLLLLVVFVLPTSTYLAVLFTSRPHAGDFLHFIMLFFLFFMILFYCSMKITYLMARLQFGDAEIREQRQRDRQIAAETDGRIQANEGGYNFGQVFGYSAALCLFIFGMIGGAIGKALGDIGTYGKIGAFIGVGVAWVIANKLTQNKSGEK